MYVTQEVFAYFCGYTYPRLKTMVWAMGRCAATESLYVFPQVSTYFYIKVCMTGSEMKTKHPL